MNYHFDHEIRLGKEPEHHSLYKWYLQEYSGDGSAIGSKVIPWVWSLWFSATELQYRLSVELTRDHGVGDDSDARERGAELLTATLRPGTFPSRRPWDREPWYSMLGTDRTIQEFRLEIHKLGREDLGEKCEVRGWASYTAEIDFHDVTESDELYFMLWLRPSTFAKVVELAKAQGLSHVTMRVTGVSGFYSDWSPSISTTYVKVLTNDTEHKVVVTEGMDIEPPRLGAVEQFELHLVRSASLPDSKDDSERDANSDAAIEEQPTVSEKQLEAEKDRAIREIATQLVRSQSLLMSLRLPVWLAVVLLLLVLLAR